MRPSEIKAGRTYRNRGSGRTTRRVLAIGWDVPFVWFGNGQQPVEHGVRFQAAGQEYTIALSSFAKWAGSELTDG